MTLVGSLLIAVLAIAVDFLIGRIEKMVKRHGLA